MGLFKFLSPKNSPWCLFRYQISRPKNRILIIFCYPPHTWEESLQKAQMWWGNSCSLSPIVSPLQTFRTESGAILARILCKNGGKSQIWHIYTKFSLPSVYFTLPRHFCARCRGPGQSLIWFGHCFIKQTKKNCYKVNKFLDIIRNNHLVFLPIIRTETTILIALSRVRMCLTSPLNGIKSWILWLL